MRHFAGGHRHPTRRSTAIDRPTVANGGLECQLSGAEAGESPPARAVALAKARLTELAA